MKKSILKKKRRYKTGDSLGDNEYLLRVEDDIGYLSKLNKDGSVSKNFIKWRNYGVWNSKTSKTEITKESELDIMIHRESFSSGWKFVSFRGGESQDWAVLKHPLGFEVEVYIHTFIDMIQDHTIINGVLQGQFKWSYSKLVCKRDVK